MFSRITTFFAALATALALSTAAHAANAGPTTAHSGISAYETRVVAKLNATRVTHGLRRLRISRPLASAAEEQSRAMGAAGFFAHDSAEHGPFWKRLRKWYSDTTYRWWAVGENLLWTPSQVDATTAIGMWMRSPKHRANILDRRWREIGIAAVQVEHAPGVYGGRDVTIITTDFGARLR